MNEHRKLTALSRRMVGWSLGVLILLFFGFAAQAGTTYYVNQATGSDSYNGLYETHTGGTNGPFKTIAKAVGNDDHGGVVTGGDTIIVHAGVYRDYVRSDANGSAGNPITIQAASGERVVLSAAEEITGWTRCASANDAGGNANYAQIWYADINWRPGSVTQDEVRLQEGRYPADCWWVATDSGSTVNGDAATIDTVHLTQQSSSYWDGADFVFNDITWSGAEPRTPVKGYNPTTHTVTYDAELGSLAAGKLYGFLGRVDFINGAGQFTVKDLGGGSYRLFLWPAGSVRPDGHLIEGSHARTALFRLNGVGYWTIEGLEFCMIDGMGSVGAHSLTCNDGGPGHITVRNCTFRSAAFAASSLSDSLLEHNLFTDGGNITVGGTDVVFEHNEFGNAGSVNINIVGGGSWETAATNVSFIGNYIHDVYTSGHPDLMHSWGYVSGMVLEDNLLVNSGSAIIMMEATQYTTLTNNILVGSGSSITCDQPITANGNTFWGAGQICLRANGILNSFNNVFDSASPYLGLGPSSTYTGDYNLFGSMPAWDGNYLTFSAYQDTVAPQDANSLAADPEFTNAPLSYHQVAYGALGHFTSTKAYLGNESSLSVLSVGDHITFDFDGVDEVITNLGTDAVGTFVEFTPPAPRMRLVRSCSMQDWGDNDDFTLDMSLKSTSPGHNANSTGGDMGATLDMADYMAADFNGDGTRDVPVWPPTPATLTQWETLISNAALAIAEGGVEVRSGGVTKLRLTFDEAIQSALVTTSAFSIVGDHNGNQSSLISGVSLDSTSKIVTINLSSALPDDDIYVVTAKADLRAVSGGLTVGDKSIRIGVKAGEASAGQSTVSIGSSSIPCDNSTTATVTITLKNGAGANLSGRASDISLSAGEAGGVTFGSVSTTSTSGVYTATVRCTTQSDLTISVQVVDHVNGTSMPITVSQTVALNVTATARLIAASASSLSPVCGYGSNADSQTFDVWNSGETGTLSYTISDNAAWLSVSPSSGTSAASGNHQTHTVSYSTASLSLGTHSATITITDSGAGNSPVATTVTLAVTVPANGQEVQLDISSGFNLDGFAGPAERQVMDDDNVRYYTAFGGEAQGNSAIPGAAEVAMVGNDGTITGGTPEDGVITVSGDRTYHLASYQGNDTLPGDWLEAADPSGYDVKANVVQIGATHNRATWQVVSREILLPAEQRIKYTDVNFLMTGFGNSGSSQLRIRAEYTDGSRALLHACVHGDPGNQGALWYGPGMWDPNEYYQPPVAAAYTTAYTMTQMMFDAGNGNIQLLGGSFPIYRFTAALTLNSTKNLRAFLIEDSDYTANWNGRGLEIYAATATATGGGLTEPQISVSESSLRPTCNYGSNASNQTFDVWNSGVETLSYTVSDNAAWLSVSATSGTSTGSHDTHTVSYSTSGLSPGTYAATITVTDSGASNSPVEIPVTLTVTAVPEIARSPSSLSPTCVVGANAGNQTFDAWNSGTGTLSYTVSDDAAWLSVSAASGTSTGSHNTHTVSYSTSSLGAGTYTATITISASGVSNSPQTVSVSLTVSTAVAGGEEVQLDISGGFNMDGIAGPGDRTDMDTANQYYNQYFGDESAGYSSWNYYVECLTTNNGGTITGCIPANGVVTSEASETVYHLASASGNSTYSGNWADDHANCVEIGKRSSWYLASRTITLPSAQRVKYSEVNFLMNGQTDGGMEIVANYTDSSTEVIHTTVGGSNFSGPGIWNIAEYSNINGGINWSVYTVGLSVDQILAGADQVYTINHGNYGAGGLFELVTAATLNSSKNLQGFTILDDGNPNYNHVWTIWAATAVTVENAQIAVSTTTLTPQCQMGNNASNGTFDVWNSQSGTLSYTISDSATWLSESATSGTSTGSHNTHTVSYSTSGLSVGTYTATITVSATGASNSPQEIGVTLTVTPGNPSANVSDVSVNPTVIFSGVDSTTITITLKDAYNNSIGGLAGGITISASPSSGNTIGSVSETATTGVYTATMSCSTNGDRTVSVVASSIGLNDTPTVHVQTAVSAATSTVTVDSTSIRNDGTRSTTVTITLLYNGNPVSGQAGSLTLSSTSSAGSFGAITETGSSGIYTATYTDTTVGSPTITATAGYVTVTDTASVDVYQPGQGDFPLAEAGADQEVTANSGGTASVTLSGSGSQKGTNASSITEYLWTEGEAVLSDTSSATAVVQLEVGVHEIVLTVLNNLGEADSDSLTVTVNAGGGQEVQLDISGGFNMDGIAGPGDRTNMDTANQYYNQYFGDESAGYCSWSYYVECLTTNNGSTITGCIPADGTVTSEASETVYHMASVNGNATLSGNWADDHANCVEVGKRSSWYLASRTITLPSAQRVKYSEVNFLMNGQTDGGMEIVANYTDDTTAVIHTTVGGSNFSGPGIWNIAEYSNINGGINWSVYTVALSVNQILAGADQVYNINHGTYGAGGLFELVTAATLNSSKNLKGFTILDDGNPNYNHVWTIWAATAVTVENAQIGVSTATLTSACDHGQNASNQTFDVWNSQSGTLNYSISDSAAWLSVSATSGTSTGSHNTHTVSYSTSSLDAGTYTATITVSASGVSNSPQEIAVTLTVSAVPEEVQLDISGGFNMDGIAGPGDRTDMDTANQYYNQYFGDESAGYSSWSYYVECLTTNNGGTITGCIPVDGVVTSEASETVYHLASASGNSTYSGNWADDHANCVEIGKRSSWYLASRTITLPSAQRVKYSEVNFLMNGQTDGGMEIVANYTDDTTAVIHTTVGGSNFSGPGIWNIAEYSNINGGINWSVYTVALSVNQILAGADQVYNINHGNYGAGGLFELVTAATLNSSKNLQGFTILDDGNPNYNHVWTIWAATAVTAP